MRLAQLSPYVGVAYLVACGLVAIVVLDLIRANERGAAVGLRTVVLSGLIVAVVFAVVLVGEARIHASAVPISCERACGWYPDWLCSLLFPGC